MHENNKDSGDKVVIVVGREYGSGGRRIAEMLATRLGISYYDKTLLNKAAESLNYSADIFTRADEKRPSLLRSLLTFSYGATTAAHPDSPVSDEKLYEFQSRVIRDICSRESCVIVGRTADYILRDHPRMLSLFIHAPLETRARAVLEREKPASLKEAAEIARRNDRHRASYYNYYTNSDKWGHAHNYHLTFDSSRIDDDAIEQIVRAFLGL